MADLVRGPYHSRNRWELLDTHFQVRELDIPLLRSLQQSRSDTLRIRNWLRIRSNIRNAKIGNRQCICMRWSVMIWKDLPIGVDVVRKHQLLFILCHILVIHYLRSITRAPKRPRILLDLKLNLVRGALILLILNIELPNRILAAWVARLIFRRRHFPRLQIVLAVLWSTILVGELNHSIPIRSGRNRQVWAIVVGSWWLINLLRRINVPRQLAAELLARRLLATLLLLVVLQLLIAHWIISWTYSFLDNHPSCITASVPLLSESCRIHVASRSSWIDRVLFDDLVYAVVAASLDHGAVLSTHVLASCKLLDSSEIRILWCD